MAPIDDGWRIKQIKYTNGFGTLSGLQFVHNNGVTDGVDEAKVNAMYGGDDWKVIDVP